jgi:prophage regulatory protein
MCGLPTSTLYYLMGRGEFPANVQLSRRIVAWRESEILSWLANRPTYQPKVEK